MPRASKLNSHPSGAQLLLATFRYSQPMGNAELCLTSIGRWSIFRFRASIPGADDKAEFGAGKLVIH